MTRNASHGSRLSANNLPQDLCAGWPQIVWQLAVPSTDEGDHQSARAAQAATGGHLWTSEPASSGHDRFAVHEAMKMSFLGKVIEGLTHQGEFGQFLAVEISGVLAELLQQSTAILIRQAADHLQEVLGELGIGRELRRSPLGWPAASSERLAQPSPGSTHRSQGVWRRVGHGGD